MKKSILRFAPLVLLALLSPLCQAENPSITFIGNAPTLAPGGSATLSWSATCPTGACTYSIDQGIGSVAASGTRTVTPASTRTYTLLVNNAGVGLFARTVTVFVGNGNLSITQSLAPANGGPGCSMVPQYGVCELTYTYSAAGCSRYVPATTACSGGAVTNPWEDVTIRATFTGKLTNSSYVVNGFYEGGANSGDGNQWKVRFSPQVYDVWDYNVVFSSPADYRVISTPALFTSAPPVGTGFLGLYGAANYHLLKTADGKAFYPFALNDGAVTDHGNNTAGALPVAGDLGFGASPSNGYQSSITETGFVLGQMVTTGFNLLRIGAGFANVPLISNLGVNNNNYLAGNAGVGKSRGSMTWDAVLRESSQIGMKNWCTVVNAPHNLLPGLDIFANTATTQQLMRAWQYAINRFGAYCDIWEMGNEEAVNVPYMTSFAAWIKQQDPYRHLTMMSYAPTAPIANLDLGSDHQYPNYPVNPLLTLASNFAGLISTQQTNLPNSPVIFGEVGNSTYESDPQANEQFRQFENVAFFNQAFISPWPSFVCNGIQTNNLCIGSQQQAQMALFASFTSSFDPKASKVPLSLTGGANNQNLVGYALGSADDLAGWILNTTNRKLVHNATVRMTIPAPSMAGEWIAPSTGQLLATFTTDAAAGTQTLTIPDFSSTSYNGDIWFRIRNASSPVVTTVAAPGCLLNTSCFLQLTAAGGIPGYTWAITSGALPPGLTLNAATGTINGTAAGAGNWNFTLVASDSLKTVSAPQKLILVVFAPITIGNTVMDNFILTLAASAFHLPIVVTGGVPPVTCAVTGNSPPGLSFNNYCGASGTPTTPGIFKFTATATDGQGNSASAIVTAAVPSSAVGIEQTGAPFATVNTPFNWSNLGARRGSAANSWSLSSGSLPPGINLISGVGATFSGTPTSVGSWTFSLTVTDSASGRTSDPQAYTLTVNPAPAITTVSLPQFSSAAAYYAPIVVAGGSAPYWCAVRGALPAGFILDSAQCLIYGTTSDTATFPIGVTAFDSNGAPATASLSLTNAISGGTAPAIFAGGVVPVFSASTTIQPGSWASIFGTNLATGIALWNGDFPISLGGTTVTVDGKPAFLWFVSPGQINFQVPDDAATGAVPVVVTTPNGTATSQVTLSSYAPAFLLLPDGAHVTGFVITPGPGNSGAGYDILGPSRPAKAGETIVLYGVGFGPTVDTIAAGTSYSGGTKTVNTVRVAIGGVALPPENVVFAGLVSAGLYQLNIVVPSGLTPGDATIVAAVGVSQTQDNVFLTLQ